MQSSSIVVRAFDFGTGAFRVCTQRHSAKLGGNTAENVHKMYLDRDAHVQFLEVLLPWYYSCWSGELHLVERCTAAAVRLHKTKLTNRETEHHAILWLGAWAAQARALRSGEVFHLGALTW